MSKLSTYCRSAFLLVTLFIGCCLLAVNLTEAALVDIRSTITVSGNDIYFMTNSTYTATASILVEGNATLVVQNSEIRFVQTKRNQYGITLRNPANGNPRITMINSTLACQNQPFNLTLTGNSSATLVDSRFTGASNSALDMYDSSNAVCDNATFKYVNVRNSSSFFGIAPNAFYIQGFENGKIEISAGKINSIILKQNSTASATSSELSGQINVPAIELKDNASASVNFCSLSRGVVARGASRLSLFHDPISQVKFETYDNSSVLLEESGTLQSRYMTDFSTGGTSSFTIFNCTINESTFTVKDNSTLKVVETAVGASVATLYNGSTVLFSRSSMDWLVECKGNSTFRASDTAINVLSAGETSLVQTSRCNVTMLRTLGGGQPRVEASDSRIGEANLKLESVESELADFAGGYWVNKTLSSPTFSFSLLDTELEFGWSFMVTGASNITLRDSQLVNLITAGNTTMHLWNTSYSFVYAKDDSEIQVWSYLTVNVHNLIGSAVQGAQVSVSLLGAPVQTATTESDGTALFELYDRTIDSSGDVAAGDYTVTVDYEGSTYTTSTGLRGSKILSSTVSSPWWYWYAIGGGVAAAAVVAILAVVLVVRRRKHAKE